MSSADFLCFVLSAGNTIGELNPQSSHSLTYLLVGGFVLIIALVLIIVMLYRKKNKLYQKIETQEIKLEKSLAYLQSLQNETTVETREREFEMLNRLTSALEYRDIETANHISRMASYSRLIAQQLFPVDSPVPSLIFLAASLHDIGKIGISDNILSKPEKLDDKEFKEMKRHTLIGYDILKDSSSEVVQLAATIALNHHERYDGTGYPRGLKGEEIPIAGRIVAVADYFDALVSKRVYKDAWSIDRVLEVLKKRSGTFFDPACLDAFFKSLEEILEIKDKYPHLRKSPVKDIEEDEVIKTEVLSPVNQKRKNYPRPPGR